MRTRSALQSLVYAAYALACLCIGSDWYCEAGDSRLEPAGFDLSFLEHV